MATTTGIKFYVKNLGASQASTFSSTETGSIVFDKTAHALFVNGTQYGGNVANATFTSNILTISKADGSDIQLDFSTLANAASVMEAFDDVKDELEAIETGAGLDTGGTYTADSTTNYLTQATSLKDADKKLDAQIKSLSDTVSGLTTGVSDVQINSTSIESNGVADIAVDGTYNASTNKIATESTVTDAIEALDVPSTGTGAITGFGAGKTLATLTETDGKVAATFQDIAINASQITDASTNLVTSVKGDGTYLEPTSATKGDVTVSHKTRTESTTTSTGTIGSGNNGATDTFTIQTYTFDAAGHETAVDTKTLTITFPSASDLGLSSAMHFVGTSTTDPTGAGGATVSGHTTWAAGDVVLYGNKEYVYNGTSWVELGDEGSYAQKTITITAGNCLTGGGDLTANRTISHDTITTPSTATTDTAKSQGDSVTVMTGITGDGYGHVTGYTTNTFTIPTAPTVNDATLTISDGTHTSDIFSADADTNSTLTITGTDGIEATVSTGTLTIGHSNSVTAVSTAAALKVAYDAQGHITGSSALAGSDIAVTSGTYGGSTSVSTAQAALDSLASAVSTSTAVVDGSETIVVNDSTATSIATVGGNAISTKVAFYWEEYA